MANEIRHNTITSATLYACRFQPNGDVFLTNGASDEVWGTGGRDADDYDVTMTETTIGSSRHYEGDFDASANIGAGVYQVTVYRQAGGSPADTDKAVAQGEIYWDGTAEVNLYTIYVDTNEIQGKLPDDFIMGSSVTDSMDDEINAAVGDLGQVRTIEDESPGGGAPETTSGIVEGF